MTALMKARLQIRQYCHRILPDLARNLSQCENDEEKKGWVALGNLVQDFAEELAEPKVKGKKEETLKPK